MSSSSSDSFLKIPRSNPQMEEETYTKEELDNCVKKLQQNLLSHIDEHQIANQLKEMLSFLSIYMDESNESYFDFHSEDDYPFPYENFTSDIFGANNPKRILDQVYDDHYDKFGKKIKDDIYVALIRYFYPNDDDDINSINENANPQGMGGGVKKELEKHIEATKSWHLFVLKKHKAYKEASNKASNKGSKKNKIKKNKTKKKKKNKTIRTRNTK